MANAADEPWEEIRAKVNGQCSGCPRAPSGIPLMFPRHRPPSMADFLVLAQEPGHWLLSSASGDAAEPRLRKICKESDSASTECRMANPLSKVIQVFGNFDPTSEGIYLSHALKCIPGTSDRDINKEWRRAATRCKEHLISEMRLLGKGELNVVAFGKFALEMCLDIFEGQDIDQDISISEFMQSHKLPISYRYKFKDGTSKNICLFVFTNPSSEVVKIRKTGGRMTVEEIQELEITRIHEMIGKKKGR
ncbi:MAG: uracil-DNA glycosylase family protein [Methanomassiliicoccales archaeon]|nr:uracil-DNA glycosylase family protein [Methanomassiliicoccales archaeon]